MDTLPACRPWSCKGMRSLDSFSRGPARFIIVNDGEVEVPALLLSQEMFTIMDNAVTADYRHDKQQQKNRDKILKHMNDIDNTRGYIATLDIQIKHLKHSAKRSGKKMDNDITSQLEYLIGSKATGIRRVKTMRKIIKRLDKERTESEENLRKKWKSLDLVTEEVWERAGFFDMEEVWQNAGHSEIGKQQATSQPRPRQESRTLTEVTRKAQDILAKRHQSFHEARQRYERHLDSREQGFVDWLQSKGIDPMNQYETDAAKDEFYNDYKKKAAELYQEVEEHEASYKKEHDLCRQLGLSFHSLPSMERNNPQDIIEAMNEDAVNYFKERDQGHVDAWMEAVAENRQYGPHLDEMPTYEETESLCPWDSGSRYIGEDFRRHMNKYEVLKEMSESKTRTRDEATRRLKVAVEGYAAVSDKGSNSETSTSPILLSVPPFGSVTQADGTVSIHQIKPWSSHRGVAGSKEGQDDAGHRDRNSTTLAPGNHHPSIVSSEKGFPTTSVLDHTLEPQTSQGVCFASPTVSNTSLSESPPQQDVFHARDNASRSAGSSSASLSSRKRKSEESTGSDRMPNSKRRMVEPSLNSKTSKDDQKSGTSRLSPPLIDSYLFSTSERNQSSEKAEISSVPRENQGKDLKSTDQGRSQAPSVHESLFPSKSLPIPSAPAMNIVRSFTSPSSLTRTPNSIAERHSTDRARPNQTYPTLDEEEEEEL